MIWLVLIGICLLCFIILIPTMIQGKIANTQGAVDHYKAQLSELDNDVSRGMIADDQAKSARLEIERRLVKAAQQADSKISRFGDKKWPVLAYTLAVGAAFWTYKEIGSPEAESKYSQKFSQLDQPIQPDSDETLGDALARIKTHLAANPADIKGWQILANSQMSTQQYAAASNSFGQLAQLQPTNPLWFIRRAEAMMAMSGGQITPAVRLVLSKLIDIAPSHPAGRYYLGLAYKQQGKSDEALKIWESLLASATADDGWRGLIRRQINDLKNPMPVIDEAQAARIAALPEAEKKDFFLSMAGRLEARLTKDPDNPRGWMMLARTYLMVGEPSKAIAALSQGITESDPAETQALKAMLDKLQQNQPE